LLFAVNDWAIDNDSWRIEQPWMSVGVLYLASIVLRKRFGGFVRETDEKKSGLVLGNQGSIVAISAIRLSYTLKYPLEFGLLDHKIAWQSSVAVQHI